MAEASVSLRSGLLPRVWVDIAVLTALSSIGLLGFATSFGDLSYLVAGFGGLLVGTGSALVAAYFRFDAIVTTLAVVVAYFLFGSLFAMPMQATFGVLPSLVTLSGLAVGAVFGWADIVTLTTPVAAPDYIGVLPYISTWLVGVVSATLVARWFVSRGRNAPKSFVALLGPIAIYVTSVLTGTEVPYFAALRGIGFAVIALVWMSWRVSSSQQSLSATASRAVLRRRVLGVAGVALAAVLVGGTLGFATAPPQSSRFVLRDNIQPPFDPLQYPSPLSGFRKYTKDSFKNPDAVLFTITGLPTGQRVRIATMDAFDGRLWNVTGPDVYADGSGAFALIGHRTQSTSLLTKDARATVDVKIEDYKGVWLPTVGYARDIAFDPSAGLNSTSLRYNAETGIAVVTGGLKKGMQYELQADTEKIPADDALKTVPVANVELPAVSKVPDIIASKAAQLAGDAATPIEQLRAIEKALSTEGYLSHGTASNQPPSSAGHGADRMRSLLSANQWIGDDEQFASAFALMARSLGYPARVVMGFAPKETTGGPIAVKGSDVKAWVEVAFDGVGWIPFDPTPPEFKDIPPDTTTKPKTEPQPQVRQPQRTDAKQDDLLSPVDLKKADDKPNGFAIPGWVWNVLAAISIPAAVYFIPLLLIGYLKRRRRARRRNADKADQRAAGAWDELVDTYAELGYSASRKATRLQLALGFEDQFREEVAARQLERASADVRAAAKVARVEAKAATDSTSRGTADRLTSALDATVVRARDVAAWRPGVNDDRAPLPAIPGLREFAVSADRAVFSGAELRDAEVDDLWTGAIDAEVAAQRSVSWFRRRLSKFRIRANRDITDALSARLSAAVPTSMRGAFTR